MTKDQAIQTLLTALQTTLESDDMQPSDLLDAIQQAATDLPMAEQDGDAILSAGFDLSEFLLSQDLHA